MSKDADKKSKKHKGGRTRKAAMKALMNAPALRAAWIAAIEAGAAAAIAVIRKASDAELVKLVAEEPQKPKKTKKKNADIEALPAAAEAVVSAA